MKDKLEKIGKEISEFPTKKVKQLEKIVKDILLSSPWKKDVLQYEEEGCELTWFTLPKKKFQYMG